MTNLITPWQQFISSGFRYRPARAFKNGKTYWKTNQAKWAKQ